MPPSTRPDPLLGFAPKLASACEMAAKMASEALVPADPLFLFLCQQFSEPVRAFGARGAGASIPSSVAMARSMGASDDALAAAFDWGARLHLEPLFRLNRGNEADTAFKYSAALRDSGAWRYPAVCGLLQSSFDEAAEFLRLHQAHPDQSFEIGFGRSVLAAVNLATDASVRDDKSCSQGTVLIPGLPPEILATVSVCVGAVSKFSGTDLRNGLARAASAAFAPELRAAIENAALLQASRPGLPGRKPGL